MLNIHSINIQFVSDATYRLCQRLAFCTRSTLNSFDFSQEHAAQGPSPQWSFIAKLGNVAFAVTRRRAGGYSQVCGSSCQLNIFCLSDPSITSVGYGKFVNVSQLHYRSTSAGSSSMVRVSETYTQIVAK